LVLNKKSLIALGEGILSNKAKSTEGIDVDLILSFVDSSKGLKAKISDSGRVRIQQDLDGKVFSYDPTDVIEVLHRADSEAKPFIQVNFRNNAKVLFTETLIGFKPLETLGLDMARIPKVVTTPDLVSVFEAIEEALGSDNSLEHEVEILKRVYTSIISGGEKVGFDLSTERGWLNRLLASNSRAVA
jgi:hypothetical protein